VTEPITAEGLEALRAELEELEGPGRHAMAKRIKAARELGDLKENAEYHIAKDDQAHLETRIKRIRQRLSNAVVVEADKSASSFAFGRTAQVKDVESGETNTWTLVGATEADPKQGRLSAESPVGRALQDAPVGEDVRIETPRGAKTYRVEKLVD
jgi:transcription elongation factor GreA